ncbi:MAG: nicotinate (nicotinamide) nucleotide adenylyltransferase, partial [Planctomycetota bacterium]
FDPIHLGHLLLAERCREELDLDEVRFLPAAANPLKERRPVAADRDRCDMVQFAISGHPQFRVDRRVMQRGGPSYTVETLEQIAAENPDAELFLLMGADSFNDFHRGGWKSPDRIRELATVAAVNRGDAVADVPETFDDRRVRFISMPACDFSATDLRQRAAAGQSLRYRTPAAVIACIRDRELYDSRGEGEEPKAEGML